MSDSCLPPILFDLVSQALLNVHVCINCCVLYGLCNLQQHFLTKKWHEKFRYFHAENKGVIFVVFKMIVGIGMDFSTTMPSWAIIGSSSWHSFSKFEEHLHHSPPWPLWQRCKIPWQIMVEKITGSYFEQYQPFSLFTVPF